MTRDHAISPTRTLQQREYQEEAVEAVVAHARDGAPSCLTVLATGAGKTTIGGLVVDRGRRHVVWCAHRTELIEQAAQSLYGMGLTDLGVISPQLPHLANPQARIQVASVQTLCARLKRGLELPPAALLVLDEAHHYVGTEQWSALVGHYRQLGAFVLGLTATPARSDGKPMGDQFATMHVGPQTFELIESGFLVPCEVIAPERRLRGEIAIPIPEALGMVREPGSVIVFGRSTQHAGEAARELAAVGVPCESIFGSTPGALRQAVVNAFSTGELQALSNVMVCTEGFDAPRAQTGILARPASSLLTFLQIAGRFLRLSRETRKERALLLDLVGATKRHGHPTLPRDFHLHGEQGITTPEKPCPKCGIVISLAEPACPGCGFVRPKITGRQFVHVPDVAHVPVQRVGHQALPKDPAQEYRNLRARAERLGHRPGWAFYRFREIFGVDPPVQP